MHFCIIEEPPGVFGSGGSSSTNDPAECDRTSKRLGFAVSIAGPDGWTRCSGVSIIC